MKLIGHYTWSEFSKAVDARRIFLKEVDRVRSADMSPYDRAQFISMRSKSTDPNTIELVQIAREVQTRVTQHMAIEDIYRQPDMFAAYRPQQKDEGLNVNCQGKLKV